MSPQHPHRPSSGFDGLGIAPKLLETLDKNKFTIPTPIQEKAIPPALEGKDLMGIAQTGTGKTLAFGIPMLQRLAQVKGRGLVILPTRELALQVDETFQKIGRDIHLRTAVLIGGASMSRQMEMLRKGPHIVVATPGRLIDHLNQRTIGLDDVRVLVLDEADRMLDMGFEPQIKRILQNVPKERQTMLFSATMPDQIVRIASNYMKLPVRIEVARAGTAAELVTQELFVVKKEDKNRLLEKMLIEHPGSCLVFTRTKFGAKKLMRAIKTMGQSSAEIHSNRTLSQRREALDGFKSGKYRVLVATDIAARGIDVTGIAAVINYDVPENPEDYVHRIGRTGRAGHKGHAITFAMPDQGDEVRGIEKVTRINLPISKLPAELPPHRAAPPADRFDREERGGYGRGGRSSGGYQGGGQRGRSGGYGQGRPSYGGTSSPSRGASSPHRPAGQQSSSGYGSQQRPGGPSHAKPPYPRRDDHRPAKPAEPRRDAMGTMSSKEVDDIITPKFFGPEADDSLRPPKPKLPRDFKRGGRR
jgi:ATP-dependent RNA helicase RhlE